MAITLHNLKPAHGSKKSRKRVGRGLASKGRTAGRGQKGQKSRSGVSGLKKIGLRKLMLSMPKLRGFKSPHKKAMVVNLGDIQAHFGAGETVSTKNLVKKGLIKRTGKAKILGSGEFDVTLTFKGLTVSKLAAEKILKAGGKIDA